MLRNIRSPTLMSQKRLKPKILTSTRKILEFHTHTSQKMTHLMTKIREFLAFLIFLNIRPLLKQKVKIRRTLFFLKQIACSLAMTQRSSQSDVTGKGLANTRQKKNSSSFSRLILTFPATFPPITTHT